MIDTSSDIYVFVKDTLNILVPILTAILGLYVGKKSSSAPKPKPYQRSKTTKAFRYHVNNTFNSVTNNAMEIKSPKIVINHSASGDHDTRIETENRKYKKTVLYRFIVILMCSYLLLSIYLNYDSIYVSPDSLLPFVDKFNNALFFGIISLCNSFSILIPTLSGMLLYLNIVNHSLMDNTLNIVVYALNSILGIILVFIIKRIDYTNITAAVTAVNHPKTLSGFLNIYRNVVLLIQAAFIGGQIYKLIDVLITKEAPSELMKETAQRIGYKIILLLGNFALILYWKIVL